MDDDFDREAAFKEALDYVAGASPQDDKEPDAKAAAEVPQDDGAATQPPASDPGADTSDIWANATDEQRAAFEAARNQASQLEHRLRSDDGRVSRFQRERDDLQRRLSAVEKATTQANTFEDLKALLDSEDWKKSKGEYGDDLKPVFAAIERIANQQINVTERLEQVDTAEARRLEELNTDLLSERAPDWIDLLGQPDFVPWLEDQPRHVREAFARNKDALVDVDEAEDVVARFRQYKFRQDHPDTPTPQPQSPDPRRAAQLDAAKSVKGRQPAIVADVDDGDPQAIFRQAVKWVQEKHAH